jgi:hypothetical protein
MMTKTKIVKRKKKTGDPPKPIIQSGETPEFN